MKTPEGCKEQGKICQLKRDLYGFEQAPIQWNQKLTSFLRSEELVQLKTDQYLFKETNNELFLAIGVDDGIIMEKHKDILKFLIKNLK